MRDKARKEELLRCLGDARQRKQLPSGFPHSSERAHRAARLLARLYYRDRLARSFQDSRRFASQTGHLAEDVLNMPAFDTFVRDCVLDSFDSARRLGEMAVVHLDRAPHPGPWWRDLVQYEFAYFLQTATAERTMQVMRYRRAAGSLCRVFSWALPEVLERLHAGAAVPEDLRRESTMLFCRGPEERVCVVELEKDAEAVFRSTNGVRKPEQIAAAAGLDLQQTLAVLEQFVAIGAVEPPLSAPAVEAPSQRV